MRVLHWQKGARLSSGVNHLEEFEEEVTMLEG